MFELTEAVRGRLIGSKSWNRVVRFLKLMWTVRDIPRANLGGFNVALCDKSWIGLKKAGNGHEMRVHKVNR